MQVISPLLDSPGFRGIDLGTVPQTDPVPSAPAPSAPEPPPVPPAHQSHQAPRRIDLTQYDQEPSVVDLTGPDDGLTEEERSGHYRTGPIDPNRATAPRRLMRGGEQLSVMVGHRLLVGITFLDESGNVTNARQFCGRVLEVADGVVTVEHPGEPEPAVLPADTGAYRKASTGRYTLRDTGEIIVDPDFISTWQVAAVEGD
ncbi:hypothetical protein GCM10022223_01800 [Kineosporia mesophila]|uniref:Uncharacterized protein n=1 Tax=Kineosporia mesophila TaxID=566012 RepID=A0ABP6YTN2_9ACTN|nr:hypothetical protein [Kineosporia mesophila]MCD5352306.1 hypothetical protein [Kineosporia mesophila]